LSSPLGRNILSLFLCTVWSSKRSFRFFDSIYLVRDLLGISLFLRRTTDRGAGKCRSSLAVFAAVPDGSTIGICGIEGPTGVAIPRGSDTQLASEHQTMVASSDRYASCRYVVAAAPFIVALFSHSS